MRAVVGVQVVASGDGRGARAAGRRQARCATGSATSPRRPACTTTSPSPRTSASSPGCSASPRDRGRPVHRGRRPRRPPATRWSAGSPAASGPGSRSRSRCSASPELLVLDEPTVGLDPVLRRDLWAMFHRLADAGHGGARVQPRDGRGRALRPAAADARRAAARRRHPARRCSRAPARATSRTRSSRWSREAAA